MDLSIPLQDTILYIRVAGVVKTPNGFLFEKHRNGYIYTLGGKVMLNESSAEAIKREILEEIGLEIEEVTLIAIIENFYTKSTEKVHEICFVYKIRDIFTKVIPEGFIELEKSDFQKYDIRPNKMIGIINTDNIVFQHVIIK